MVYHTAFWSLCLLAVFTVVPVWGDNTELLYRIVPDTQERISSMLLLDGGKLLLASPDRKQLSLVNLQNPNTTVSSLQLPEKPYYMSKLSDQKILISFLYYDRSRWLIVNISGDVLQLEGEVNTQKGYYDVCSGPNNTFFASSQGDRNTPIAHVNQLDLQGKILRTVYNETKDPLISITLLGLFGNNLYATNGPLIVINLATGAVTTTIGQTDPSILGRYVILRDLDFDHKGDAYLCVDAAEVCGNASSCIVRITPSGNVTALTTFFSRPSQLQLCYDVIATTNQLLVNWLGYDDVTQKTYSEIAVQTLPL